MANRPNAGIRGAGPAHALRRGRTGDLIEGTRSTPNAIRHSSTVRLVQPPRNGHSPGGPGGLPARRHPGGGPARDDGRRMAHLGRRPRRHPLRAARPDRRRQLRRPGARLALPDREPRPTPRLLPADHPADDRRRALHHRRQPAQRGRHRRGHRRAPVAVPPRRGRARGAVRAAALRARRRLLDRRGRRPTDLLRHHRLPARGPRREDRLADSRLRRRRHRRPQAEQRPGPRPDHERAGLERRARRRRRHRPRRRREPLGPNPAEPPQRQGLRARLRRPHRRTEAGSSTPSRSRASSGTRRGRTAPGSTPATPASGPR